MVGLCGGRKQRLRRGALLLPADTIERPRDREGEMEPRDRETNEAEWKPHPNRRERIDAHIRVFP
jgi:hypothetical protein